MERSVTGSPLSAAKLAVLERRRKGESAGVGSAGTITRLADRTTVPLSFAQARLWFLDQLIPGSSFYNIPTALRIQGPLDQPALESAVSALFARHEPLRATFQSVEGTPVQVIGGQPENPVVVNDLSHLPASQREAEAERLGVEELQRPFDLSAGPMLRVLLLRLGPQDHHLIFTMHHIVSDQWSAEVLKSDFAALYGALAHGKTPSLPELPLQYADFAAWQRQRFQGNVLEEHLAYWKKKLAGLSVIPLPTDFARPPLETHRGATVSRELSEGLSRALQELSAREGTTLFMTMLAAFKALLHRFTAHEDIVIGTPVANRTRTELEGLIGFFVTTLVLRTRVSGDMTFHQLLSSVRETALEGYAHQDVPFEKLVEELEPERDSSRNPLFQVVFALQNVPKTSQAPTNQTMSILSLSPSSARFDVEFFVWDTPTQLFLSVTYATDLFSPETVERLLTGYQRFLESVVQDPDQRVRDVRLLSGAEEQKLVGEWCGVRSDYPRGSTVHALFEKQAALTPEAVAVVFEGQRLSYGELNRRANQVAWYLKARGAGPDVLVGLCVERGFEMVVGMLGILKSGAAYLPLDPEYPAARIEFMLRDTGARLVLTQQKLKERLTNHGSDAICLDSDWGRIRDRRSSNPDAAAGPECLAYVMYTSGSTGEPKGVAVTHRGVVRLVSNSDYVRLGPDEVVLQYAPLSFDASTFEIWGALLNGGRLEVCPPGALSLEELGAAIRQRQVSTLWLTSALFQQMVEWRLEDLRGVRQLLAGGDVLSTAAVTKMLEAQGDGVLINGYGPTENTTFSCCHVMRKGTVVGRSVPIGRPIANTKVYVLDASRQPVPVGVAGELYVGGDGLARGYLNRTELTAERFVPDPFDRDLKARLYRTGDQVRWLPDGTLEFLGRIDTQVKVRGFRIELGEVESVLSGHPGVQEAAAMVREDSPGEKRLVAYVVPRGESPQGQELRGYLRERVPEYMVPSVFVMLETLPLSANGKVDRRALPAPPDPRSAMVQEYVEPRNEQERIIARCWSSVLSVPRTGIHDNFFELGGNSLVATRLMDLVNRSLGTKLPLRALFREPTVAGLAGCLVFDGAAKSYRYREPTERWSYLVPMQPRGPRPPLFLVAGGHAEEAEFLRYLSHMIPHLGLDQPVYGFKPRGLDGRMEAHQSVAEMARDYLGELREFQPSGPYLLGGECIGGVVAFEMAQQLQRRGENVGLLVLMDTARPSALYATRLRRWYRFRRVRNLVEHLRIAYTLGPLKGSAYFVSVLARVMRLTLPTTERERALRRIKMVELSYPQMLTRYKPERYPGKITLVVNEVEHGAYPSMGWESLAGGGIDVDVVPGDHYTRLTMHGKTVAQKLRDSIDKATAVGSEGTT